MGPQALIFRGSASIDDVTVDALKPVGMGALSDHLAFRRSDGEDSIVCQSIANLKILGAMDVLDGKDRSKSRSVRILDRLEKSLAALSGKPFEFKVVREPSVGIRVVWGNITMLLQQLPDGLRSIIGWLVACIAKLDAQFPKSDDPLSLPLILLLDEPETHLHPSWQRQIIPCAQMLFPESQIFVATHSPFVISSVNEGFIHIFRANSNGVVTIDGATTCSRGDSWLDAVEDVLGVKEWYDPETEELLAQFRTMRDSLRSGNGNHDDLLTLAKSIAERSESLNDIMGREMWQLDRQLGRV